jgi:hypothetical protein
MLREDIISEVDEYVIHTSAETQKKKMQIFICTFMCILSWNVVVALLLVVVGPNGPTTTNSTATTKFQR